MRTLVLDANILIRAALGPRVRRILREHHEATAFHLPDAAFAEANRHIGAVTAKHGLNQETSSLHLEAFASLVEIVPSADYAAIQDAALRRIAPRDPDDWPALAAALLLKAPIWTEDRDFFGTGVATWTTSNVVVYLRGEG